MSFVNTVDVIGDEALAASIIDRSITEIADNLTTRIGGNAFNGCNALTSVDFQAATIIGPNAFIDCRALTSGNFPAATIIETYAFNDCTELTRVDFPAATIIETYAFVGCAKLTAIILRSETMATLSKANAFIATPIASGTGYIYVPAALVDSYKTATNWSTYANQIRAIEDYPEVRDPYSWEGVAAAIEKGTYKDVYKIGDSVPVDLGSEGVINMQIAAFDADTLADGSGMAAISWVAKEVLPTTIRMNPANANNAEGTGAIGGWEKCEMRAYLQNTIKPLISEEVKRNIVLVTKTHKAYNTAGSSFVQSTEDEVWIPAEEEIVGGVYSGLFPDQASRIKDSSWALRTASYTNHFKNVSGYNGEINGWAAPDKTGVCLGFCTGVTPT